MFLKSVEIFGFKSFADKTRIEFREGITALLGPNGCGKSNVVDAIKWVLGEQSGKTLRADKMEDVIFNGTETRKKVNVAEVTLTVCNETGWLDLEMPEISVRRRLYRSGESEYFINQAPVKLKEVRELFMDTGIGKSAYSVMEQGRISQILSNRPEERRYIFEEAAGITKFKVKRLEAERKLEQTADNMTQIENILSEVKKTHDTLKKQAEKTQKYRHLIQQSFEQELDIQLLKLKELNEVQFQKEKSLNELTGRLDALAASIQAAHDYLSRQMGAVNSMEGRLSETNRELYGLEMQKKGLDDQIRLLKEQIDGMDEQIALKIQKEKTLSEHQAQLESDIQSIGDVLQEFDRRLDTIETNIAGFTEQIESSEFTIHENTLEISDLNRMVRESENRKDDLASDIREMTGELVASLDESLKQSGYSAAAKAAAAEAVQRALEQLRIRLEGSAAILSDAAAGGDAALSAPDLFARTHSAFQTALADVGQLKKAFDDFFCLIPSFIDDFIAPEGMITRKRRIEEQMEAAVRKAAECRDRVEDRTEANAALTARIREYRSTLNSLKEDQLTLEKQRSAFDAQVKNTIRERDRQKRELDGLSAEIEAERERQNQLNSRISDSCHTKETLLSKEKSFHEALSRLEAEIKKNHSETAEKEEELKKLTADQAQLREQADRLQLALVSVRSDIQHCYTNFRERNSRDLSEFEERMYEIKTPIQQLREALSASRDEIRLLGPVNLMAVEEFAEIKERYDFLNRQLEDLRTAKNDLVRVTEQIITESVELFLDTFKQIHKNFHAMFRRLFGGGRAELRLTQPESVLNSGIDIYAQPPGKNLENISLLSGGEKSMTAVALLFATYQVRPAPFCILDEIDAALDEANISRFISVLSEFSEKSQFIVITHNKKTVTGAKTLLGVTMQESGVSTVISVRLREADDWVDSSAESSTEAAPAV